MRCIRSRGRWDEEKGALLVGELGVKAVERHVTAGHARCECVAIPDVPYEQEVVADPAARILDAVSYTHLTLPTKA